MLVAGVLMVVVVLWLVVVFYMPVGPPLFWTQILKVGCRERLYSGTLFALYPSYSVKKNRSAPFIISSCMSWGVGGTQYTMTNRKCVRELGFGTLIQTKGYILQYKCHNINTAICLGISLPGYSALASGMARSSFLPTISNNPAIRGISGMFILSKAMLALPKLNAGGMLVESNVTVL